MRIIAGTARSLPLKTIEGRETRPTTDRIKETLFNMIHNDMPGCYFLDLFAGSGQIGLEALSRGASYAVFVENNKKAAACIEENIRFTKFTDKSKLIPSDVMSAISMLEGKYRFDVIFMDPPRAGSTQSFMASAISLNPDRIVYISCNPETLARDLEFFKKHQYTAEKIQPVDMFPFTTHMETVCRLTRRK